MPDIGSTSSVISLNRKLTEQETLLIELVHYMAYGTDLDLNTVKTLLVAPIPGKKGKNCLECLEAEGRAFMNELKTFVNDLGEDD